MAPTVTRSQPKRASLGWANIYKECFQHLVESMPHRIKAVLKAKAGQTALVWCSHNPFGESIWRGGKHILIALVCGVYNLYLIQNIHSNLKHTFKFKNSFISVLTKQNFSPLNRRAGIKSLRVEPLREKEGK